MCLPWKHDWKDHWKVYHETRWSLWIGPTRLFLLGQQCNKCGKWKPLADNARAPQRGRVRRRGPRALL